MCLAARTWCQINCPDRPDYDNTCTDTNKNIEAFPNLRAIKAVSAAHQNGTCKQTMVHFDYSPQVVSYHPSKPVKDYVHTGANFGSPSTPVWSKSKLRLPTKLMPAIIIGYILLQCKMHRPYCRNDLSRENIRGEQIM